MYPHKYWKHTDSLFDLECPHADWFVAPIHSIPPHHGLLSEPFKSAGVVLSPPLKGGGNLKRNDSASRGAGNLEVIERHIAPR